MADDNPLAYVEAILSAALAGSFAKAAKRLWLTSSAVSRSVVRLETERYPKIAFDLSLSDALIEMMKAKADIATRYVRGSTGFSSANTCAAFIMLLQ